jgi:hypothetical protein
MSVAGGARSWYILSSLGTEGALLMPCNSSGSVGVFTMAKVMLANKLRELIQATLRSLRKSAGLTVARYAFKTRNFDSSF